MPKGRRSQLTTHADGDSTRTRDGDSTRTRDGDSPRTRDGDSPRTGKVAAGRCGRRLVGQLAVQLSVGVLGVPSLRKPKAAFPPAGRAPL